MTVFLLDDCIMTCNVTMNVAVDGLHTVQPSSDSSYIEDGFCCSSRIDPFLRLAFQRDFWYLTAWHDGTGLLKVPGQR